MKKTTEFSKLIRSRKAVGEALSEDGQGLLQEAVFRLISHHQDTDHLVTECVGQQPVSQPSLHVADTPENLTSLAATVFSLVEQIQERSRLLAVPMDTVAANFCATKLLFGVEKLADGGVKQIEFHKLQNFYTLILKTVQTLVTQNCFSVKHFADLICQESCLPLYVVWQLHTHLVVTLDIYLKRRVGDEGFVSQFCQQLMDGCTCTEEEHGHNNTIQPARKQSLQGILQCLVRLTHSDRQDDGDTDLRKVAQHILDKFMADVVERVASPDGFLQPDFITSLIGDKRLDNKTLVAFASHQLSQLLKRPPNGETEEAFRSQNLWTFMKSPDGLTGLIKQLFLVLSASDVARELSNGVQSVSVGWRLTLTLTSTFLLCFSEATALLKELVRDLLAVSLERCDHFGVKAAFLLARQASLEGPHVFPPYSHWFQAVFGDSVRSPANNRKAFLFLMKFLTDLVPQESAVYLKAHILKPPFVPPKCRELLSDYLLLAKTRLADLKDPIDGSSAEDTEVGQSVDKRKDQRLEDEVQKALSVFETSGKIPAFIIEASIFKKPYYIGRFLPALLKPRTLPDEPDMRMKLIEELKRAEKLPVSLYNNYRASCEQEKLQLLEGLGTDDDDMEDALLEPMEQLRFRLDQLIQTMDQGGIGQKQKSEFTRVAEVVSHISEKIGIVLDCGSRPGSPGCVSRADNHCLWHPRIPQLHLQVVDCLLNAICKMVTLGERDPQTLGKTLLSLIGMLSGHTSLWPSLLARLYQLVTIEGYSLETHHIAGLAALLLAIGSTSSLWEPVTMQDTKMSAKDVIEHLIGQLPFHTNQWMKFALRFCTGYLKYSLGCFPSRSTEQGGDNCKCIPASLIKKFFYLCLRLSSLVGSTAAETSPMQSTCVGPQLSLDISQSIYNSAVFNDVLMSSQLELTFAEWIEYELQINPIRDILSHRERCCYYFEMSHNHFLSQGVGPSGCGLTYPDSCSLIIQALLKHRQTPNSSICPQCQNDNIASDIHRNRDAIIGLLQNLSVCLSTDDTTCTSQSWLVEALETHINKSQAQDTEVSSKLRLQEFMSIATSLQPSLLYSNSLSQISLGSIEAALKIISSSFKQLLSEGCFLPFHLTAYCITGLSTVLQGVLDKSCVPDLLHGCPILIASLMAHWTHLGNLVNVFLRVCGPQFSTEVHRVRNWAERCVNDGAMEQMDRQLHVLEWLCGVAIFSVLNERSSLSAPAFWTEMGNHCCQVMYVCAVCLTHQLTWLQMYSQAELAKEGDLTRLTKTIQDIFTARPIIISDMCSQNLNSFVTKNLVGSSVCRLQFATLLRVIVKLSPGQLDGMFLQNRTDLVRGMLQLYVQAGQLYDTFHWGAGHNHQEILDPLRIEEFHKFRSCLLQLLSRLSAGQLRDLQVDQSILHKCDPVIRAIVR